MNICRFFRYIALTILAVHGQASANQASTDLGKSLARGGQTSAERDLSSRNPQAELGVSVEGTESGGGRRVDVSYSQVLTGSLDCPTTIGEGGRRVGVQQFVAQCQTETGSNRHIWLCVPNDSSDTVDSDCVNGSWHSVSTTLGATYKPVVTGLSVRIPNCDGTECELELKKSGDFSGGEAEAQSEGNTARAGASGASAIVRDQGAALPDGTILSPGSNANSGQYVGELMAAGSVGSCAEDIKASIKNGTPVFTCDGNKEVDTLTGSGSECKDIETCISTEEEELLSSKTCTVSLNYENAQCDIRYVTKTCDVANVTETEKCTISTVATHVKSLKAARSCVSATVSRTKLVDYIDIPQAFLNQTVDYRYYRNSGGWGGSIYEWEGSMAITSHRYKLQVQVPNTTPTVYVYKYPYGSSNRVLNTVALLTENSVYGLEFCLRPSSDYEVYYIDGDNFVVERSPYIEKVYNRPKIKSEYAEQGYKLFTDIGYMANEGKLHIYTSADGAESCEAQ
jgi:hypothetical protein